MCLAGANTAISEKAADPRPATLILSVVTPFTVIFTVPLFVPGAIVIDWTAESALAPCADVAKEEALEKAALFKPCTVAFDSISSTFNVIWPLFLPSDMLIFRGGLANKTNDLSESFHL